MSTSRTVTHQPCLNKDQDCFVHTSRSDFTSGNRCQVLNRKPHAERSRKASTERVRIQGEAFTLDIEESAAALRQGGEERATPAATRPAASRASSDPMQAGSLPKRNEEAPGIASQRCTTSRFVSPHCRLRRLKSSNLLALNLS